MNAVGWVPAERDRPRLAGRVILLNNYGLSGFRRVILAEFLARNPDEVAALIDVSLTGPVEVGTYAGGAKAYTGVDRIIAFFDVRAKKIMKTVYAKGSRSPAAFQPAHGWPGLLADEESGDSSRGHAISRRAPTAP